MFYEPKHVSREMLTSLGLAHSPFTALVVPRPIGWISSLSASGVVNLAPFSFFNAVSQRPPMVMFCANGAHARGGGPKDSLANVRATGEFVANLATWDLRQQMNDSSTPAPSDVDEFDVTGLTKAPSRIVKPPRVAESPVNLECEVVQIVDLPGDEKSGTKNTATFGRVVGIHIDERIIRDGRVDLTLARPLARLGYLDYASIDSLFEIKRPSWPLGGAPGAGDG
jgi:flavin reductase (DIM6/NTAB) family NADH-FMN oxidoreductase RutF